MITMKTLRHRAVLTALVLTSVVITLQAPADDSTPATFDQILHRYETVRLALTQDTTDGVSEQAAEIGTLLRTLETDWSPAAAGILAEHAEEVRELLPELRRAAAGLRDAMSLETARDAFYELSKPLVRWRRAATGERPTVAYCSMARRSWLQPEGELGNPYYGQSMLRCGESVEG